MAGSPLKRQRKLGVRDEDGSVAFPFLPRVADLPRGWRRWSPAGKVEHPLGMTLDQAHDILSWPVAELDPHRLNLLMQVWPVVFMIGGWHRPHVFGNKSLDADRWSEYRALCPKRGSRSTFLTP
jgi:hypothetical protein